jgi:hypothetical protein
MSENTIFDFESIELPGAEENAPKPEFTIDNDKTAEWALEKIREEKDEYERIQALADDAIAKAQHKADQAKKRYEANSSFLTSKLAQYFETVPKKATKTQETYRLLSGTLVRKLPSTKPTPDKEKLAAWLKANGYANYIKTVEEPRWGDFKKLLNFDKVPTVKETGEIVEGITLEPKPGEFNVKFK